MNLFTAAEDQQWADRRKAIENQYHEPNPDRPGHMRVRRGEWDAYWAARESVDNAYKIVRARRIQANPRPLIDALLLVLATKGGAVLDVLGCYSAPQPSPVGLTDRTRRELHTMLAALRDCPKTWAKSAFMRMLRGTGAQKTYAHEATGTFGTGSGWKTRELDCVADPLFNGVSSEVFVWYDPRINDYPDEEMWEAAFATGGNGNPFAFTLVEKDKEFINKVLALLEADGIGGPLPKPTRKGKGKTKQWKVGDRVSSGNIRLLPVGAEVSVHLFQRDFFDPSKPSSTSRPAGTTYIFKGPGKRKSTYTRDLMKNGRIIEPDQTCAAWAMEGTVVTVPKDATK